MKKKEMVFLVVAILLVVIVAFFAVKALLNDGYAFWGDVWETSPEKALQKAAERMICFQLLWSLALTCCYFFRLALLLTAILCSAFFALALSAAIFCRPFASYASGL